MYVYGVVYNSIGVLWWTNSDKITDMYAGETCRHASRQERLL